MSDLRPAIEDTKTTGNVMKQMREGTETETISVGGKEYPTLAGSLKAVGDHAATKVTEIADHTAVKVAEVDAHTQTKITEMTDHTATKIAEVDSHTIAQKAEAEAIVTQASLDTTAALNTFKAYNPRGAWGPDTPYDPKDLFVDGGTTYLVIDGHTSTTVAADVAAGKVVVFQGDERLVAEVASQIKGQWYPSVSAAIADHGAGEGADYDAGSIRKTIDQSGLRPSVINLAGDVTFKTDFTWPQNKTLDLSGGATIIVDGCTLTLNCGISADIRPDVFELKNGGEVEGNFYYIETPTVPTVVALRKVRGSVRQRVQLQGYYSPGDGGGGPPRSWRIGDAPETWVDNNVSVITPEGGDGSEAWAWDYQGPIGLRWGGAQGDGVTDDTVAIYRIINISQANVIVAPPGKYKHTSLLDFGTAGIDGEGGTGTSSGLGGVEFCYYGSGYAMAIRSASGQSFKKFTLKSCAADQSGLVVLGVHPVVDQIRIDGFTGVSLRVGTGTGNSIVPAPDGIEIGGCYYSKIDNIYIHNNTDTQADIGLFNDGGSPSANANTYRNVIVNGRFDILYYLKGTNNTLYGGDCDPVNTVATCTAAYKIDGINIVVREPYCEVAMPKHFFWFGPNSFSCRVYHPHFVVGGRNLYSTILDEGWANSIEMLPIGYNFLFSRKNRGSQNLIANSHFKFWDSFGKYGACPEGWVNWSGDWQLDKTIKRGPANSVKVVCNDSAANLAFYPTSQNGNHNSPNHINAADIRGMTFVASVWCKTNVAGMGGIKVGGVGLNSHSGSGEWELLTAVCQVNNDEAITELPIELRSNTFGGNITGTVWFSEPCCYFGTVLEKEAPRPLTDSIAQMYGPFIQSPFAPLDVNSTTPSVADGNLFEEANTEPTTILHFLNGREGQEIKIKTTSENTILANSDTIQTMTGVDKPLVANKIYQLIRDRTKWYEF